MMLKGNKNDNSSGFDNRSESLSGRYTQALDDLAEIVIIEDPVGTIRYVNNAFCRCHGVEAAEAVGRSIFDFIIPEDREACTAHNWVTPENDTYRIEGRSKRADGKIIWLQYMGKAFFSEDGQLLEFQELALDITKWKEALQEQSAELEKVSRRVNEFREAAMDHHKKGDMSSFIPNSAAYTFQDIVTCAPSMDELKRYAASVAAGESSVLIEGESGTGKEMFAQSIHNASMRSNGPFVAVNCGAIPEELIGSEFFGYESGAFTGASRGGKKGKFEMASGGTLFLDEVGEMPMQQQVSLLRVLESRSISRVGGNDEIPVDFRLICATNKNLAEECAAGRFRKDLYYRINAIHLEIPPLRKRREDIFLLVGHFIRAIGSGSFRRDSAFNDQQLIRLYQYDWPGNVRELKNIVERIRFNPDADLNSLLGSTAAGAGDGAAPVGITGPAHGSPDSQPPASAGRDIQAALSTPSGGRDLQAPAGRVDDVRDERRMILDLLDEYEGNVSMTARKMGISRNTLYRKMKKHRIT